MSEYEFYCLLNLYKLIEGYKNNLNSEEYNNIINEVCCSLEKRIEEDCNG